MSDTLDWIEVTGLGNRTIGAVGFIGDNAVAIVSFYDDRDGNLDGRVSLAERVVSAVSPLSLDGQGVTRVAMAARVNMDIVMRDPSVSQMAGRMFVEFGAGLVRDGIWAVYFKPGVKMTGKGVARVITGSMVKQIVIRKGFEAAAREAFNAATRL